MSQDTKKIVREIDQSGKRKAREYLSEEAKKTIQESDKSRHKNSRQSKSEVDRLKRFNKAVIFGPIFVCSSCEQKMFRDNVTKIDEKFEKLIDSISPELFKETIPEKLRLSIDLEHNGKVTDNLSFICNTCKKYLKWGKIPPMSAANNLRLLTLSEKDDVKLTELENNLIAQNIIFQKVFQLPKSRWSATKDRLVNIPISSSDVMNTITNLPRTPSEAGLVEV